MKIAELKHIILEQFIFQTANILNLDKELDKWLENKTLQ